MSKISIALLAFFVIAACEARMFQFTAVKSIDQYMNDHPDREYQNIEITNSLSGLGAERSYQFGKRVDGIFTINILNKFVLITFFT